MKEFKDYLKDKRESANLTQQQVSEAVKINLRTYQRYEEGSSYPSFNKLNHLAELMKFPYAEAGALLITAKTDVNEPLVPIIYPPPKIAEKLAKNPDLLSLVEVLKGRIKADTENLKNHIEVKEKRIQELEKNLYDEQKIRKDVETRLQTVLKVLSEKIGKQFYASMREFEVAVNKSELELQGHVANKGTQNG